MKVKIVVETGAVDTANCVFDLTDVSIPETVIVLRDYKHDEPLCNCRIFMEDGVLKAEFECKDEWLDWFPAISFRCGHSEISEGPDGKPIKTWYKNTINGLGLCGLPNFNSEIKTIREQINK